MHCECTGAIRKITANAVAPHAQRVGEESLPYTIFVDLDSVKDRFEGQI